MIETTDNAFTLQGRTARARNSNGIFLNATVFSAFAAKDKNSERLHVELTSDRSCKCLSIYNFTDTSWLK